MIVYIEYAILDNLIIDAIILYLVAITLHTKFAKLNVILALLEGVSFAIVMPFVNVNTVMLTIIKLIYSLLMVYSLNKYKKLQQFIFTYILFVTYTFVLGGACYALLNILNIPYNSTGILLNGYAMPISIVVLCISMYSVGMAKFIRLYARRKHVYNATYDVVFTVGNNKYYMRGFLDSGNALYDKSNPIVVISFACFCTMFKDFPFDKLLFDKVQPQDIRDAHYIKFNTASNSDRMLLFTIDSIHINHDDIHITKDNVTLGVSKRNFQNFDCLLHQALL